MQVCDKFLPFFSFFVNFIGQLCFVVRSGTGGRSFMQWAESMIHWSSIKWKNWLIFILLSIINTSTVSCHLPLKLMVWNIDSGRYNRFGWSGNSNCQSIYWAVLRSLVRMWYCFQVVISTVSYVFFCLLMHCFWHNYLTSGCLVTELCIAFTSLTVIWLFVMAFCSLWKFPWKPVHKPPPPLTAFFLLGQPVLAIPLDFLHLPVWEENLLGQDKLVSK